MTATPNRAEEQQIAAMLAELHEHGYRDVDHHNEIRAGARIRHVGHQWPGAAWDGTGNVVAVARSPRTVQGMPDVELIAVWDEERFGSRVSQLAQYHVQVVGGA